jgi:hypothetical protein
MPIRDEDGHRAMQAAGKAWKAIKTSGAKTWREWTEVIGPGLVKARAEAQSISNASCGKGYNAAMGALLEEYGFGNALERRRSQVTRADLLRCMDYLTEIEKWRHDAKASVLLPVERHRKHPLPGSHRAEPSFRGVASVQNIGRWQAGLQGSGHRTREAEGAEADRRSQTRSG